MNYKKFTATLLTATLIVANCVPVLADDPGVNGTGVIEYDNSVDVTYDSIQVPTIAGSTYNFTLDPTDMLYTFDKTTYARQGNDGNPGVYFHSQKTGAKIAEKLDTNNAVVVELFTLSKAPVAENAADWKAVVTAVTNDTDKTPTVTSGYYVWTPADFTAADLAAGASATGKKGVYTELNASNIKNYFNIGEKDSDDKYPIIMKTDHLAGSSVCDGKLYKDTYTDLTPTTDNKPSVDLSEYVELEADGQSIKTVKNVYKVKTESPLAYEKAAAADIAFTPAEVVYQNTTDKVVVTNKSTKKKTVKAVVTMSNIAGLSFNEIDTFTGDTRASVYFNATDGTKDAVLEQGETTATATYTLDVDGANVSANQILYQGESNGTALGGHNYYNYEAVGTTYNSNAFYVEAKANTEVGAKEAWKTYGKNATAAPGINIVYTVTDYVAPPTTYTVTYNANYTGADPATKSETVNVGSKPTGNNMEFTRDGYTQDGWLNAAEGDAVNLNDVTAATTLYAKWILSSPIIKSGVTAISEPGEDGATYSVNLVNGTASEIVFELPTGNTINAVYANGNPANLTTTNESIVTFSGNKVTLKSDSSWATATAGTIKYIKVVVNTGSSTTKDFIIKVVCNPN